ncbi:hypothetical protein CVU37_10640 [candidate division BRC1 bacterium HGW-BRC1-1]|jgi:hypothetical protein|nr:MAG: hypothetical protein CVU37_10640 [candidate division BRC1 bacterium HGW-BRC1-1]
MKTWMKRTAYIGFILFLTGLITTAFQGRFTELSAGLCIAGLAAGSMLFVRRLSRNAGLYANVMLYSLFFVLTLFTIFVIVQRHPVVFDATKAKLYSISPLTRNFLGRLSQPVHITAFVTEAEKASVSDLLREYHRHSRQVTFDVFNPYREVTRAQRFGPTVVPGDAFVEALTTQSETLGRVVKVNKLNEEEMTNAIVQLLRNETITLYFLSNHGEMSLERNTASAMISGRRVTLDELDVLKQQLERNYIRVQPLNLAQRGRVPADASAIVCIAPQTDITSSEREAISSYLDDGGRAIFMLNPELQTVGGGSRMPLRNMAQMLEQYGVLLPPEMIVRENTRQRGGSGAATFNIPVALLRHPVTDVESGVPLIFTQARPVLSSRNPDPSIRVEPILTTAESAWLLSVDDVARAVLRGQKLSMPNDPKEQGIQQLGVAVTKRSAGQPDDKATRIVVVGSGDFIASSVIDQTSWMMFQRAVNWLSNAGDLVAIPATKIERTPMVLSPGQRQFLFLMLVIVAPALVGFLGLGYSLARRELQ